VGEGAVEAGIDAEDPCGDWTGVAPSVEDEVRSCPSVGTTEAVAGRGTSAAVGVEAMNGVVRVARCGAT
jgi:hypothetical protein